MSRRGSYNSCYKKVFGAEETMRLAEPDGRIGHAEMTIGGSPIMISGESPDLDVLGPQSRGGSRWGYIFMSKTPTKCFPEQWLKARR